MCVAMVTVVAKDVLHIVLFNAAYRNDVNTNKTLSSFIALDHYLFHIYVNRSEKNTRNS